MPDEARTTLIPYTLMAVPRAGDREIRMRPMSATVHAKPHTPSAEEDLHVR